MGVYEITNFEWCMILATVPNTPKACRVLATSGGLNDFFFALAYLGWFIGPYVFITTTLFVLVVVIRRQYFSRARQILLDDNGN